MTEAIARHRLEFPTELWLRLERFRHREGLASPDLAVSVAINAGYDVLAYEERSPGPARRARPLSRSAAAELLVTAGLRAMGVPEHPRSNGA